jgi:glycosyltransferase involved in cell wall biosynthesis
MGPEIFSGKILGGNKDTKMKRILIFSLAYYPSNVSGAETAIKDITDRIEPADIEFHLVTLLFDKTAPREERIGNVQVYRVGFGGVYLSKILFIPLAALKARSLYAKLRFDAVWAMMTYMLLPVMLAKTLGVRAPHILSLQDGDPYEKVFERWFILPFTPILNYGFRTAAIVQVISSYLADWPSRRGYKGIIELIYDGANPRDLKEGTVSTEEVAELKQKLGMKPENVYLINTARLVYQKGNDDVIRALPLLPENVHFLLVGGGPDEEMLKGLVKELDVENRVIFTGQVDRSEVTKYRKAGDIFICPSRSEGLGHAMLSAMASRLPVVTTQEGGLAEFIFDAKHNPDKPVTAWVVDKNNSEQIAYAVKDIIAHPEKVVEVTKTAREMVLERFDWDKIALQMREKVFNAVLS